MHIFNTIGSIVVEEINVKGWSGVTGKRAPLRSTLKISSRFYQNASLNFLQINQNFLKFAQYLCNVFSTFFQNCLKYFLKIFSFCSKIFNISLCIFVRFFSIIFCRYFLSFCSVNILRIFSDFSEVVEIFSKCYKIIYKLIQNFLKIN